MIDTRLINAINTVRDRFHDLDAKESLDLPRIAVVGSQSSGKSSVLCSLVGGDFLPSGDGIVTRCPLRVTLVPSTTFYGAFSDTAGDPMRSFEEICNGIVKRTDELAGKKKGVSHEEIMLTISGPTLPPLTLMDLPGIVTIPVPGQASDTPEQIKEMVKRFVSARNTLILLVMDATRDVATDPVHNVVKEVDPTGERTIGVLTKMDLVVNKDYVMKMMCGNSLQLKHQCVPVVNYRDMKHADAIVKERHFFDESYEPIAPRCGSRYLALHLSELLVASIRSQMPALEHRLTNLESETVEQLLALGEEITHEKRRTTALSLINKFCDRLRGRLEGDVLPCANDVGGARIQKAVEDFVENVEEIDVGAIEDKQIKHQIRLASGINEPIFPPSKVIEHFTAIELKKLEQPVCKFVSVIHMAMKDIIDECRNEGGAFADFENWMMDVGKKSLSTYLPHATEYVKTLIRAQTECSLVRTAPYECEDDATPSVANAVDVATAGAALLGVPPVIGRAASATAKLLIGNRGGGDAAVTSVRSIVRENYRGGRQQIADLVLLVMKSFREHLYDTLVGELEASPTSVALVAEDMKTTARRRELQVKVDSIKAARVTLAQQHSTLRTGATMTDESNGRTESSMTPQKAEDSAVASMKQRGAVFGLGGRERL